MRPWAASVGPSDPPVDICSGPLGIPFSRHGQTFRGAGEAVGILAVGLQVAQSWSYL